MDYLSQKQVASSIGVSASVISNYESNERTPSTEILRSLAHLYHCSTDYLLGIDKSNTVKLLDVSMLNDKQYQLLQAFLLSLQELQGCIHVRCPLSFLFYYCLYCRAMLKLSFDLCQYSAYLCDLCATDL